MEKALDFFCLCAIISKSQVERSICECAGIGRQASLRCLCSIGRVGSSPITRTSFSSGTGKEDRYARVVELADSLDSGSSVHYARAGSSPASRTNKKRHTFVCLFLLARHFCFAKVVACERVTEREGGNPSKVPPTLPLLLVYRIADNKAYGQSQKGTTIFFRNCRSFQRGEKVFSPRCHTLCLCRRVCIFTLRCNRVLLAIGGFFW